jgi:subtilase family serine protease
MTRLANGIASNAEGAVPVTTLLRNASPLVITLIVAACNAGGSPNLPPIASMPEWQAKRQAHPACPQNVGQPACLALIVDDGLAPLCSPSGDGCGLTPDDIRARYHLTPYLQKGLGTIVAVIEEGDSPEAASDLATYRTKFRLDKPDFAKYNQDGERRSYPKNCQDFGWCVETELDIEMVSVSCPKCKIYLMESDGTIGGLEAAEARAVKLGATLISNSWTCYISWTCTDPDLPKYFAAKGVTYLASSGDLGHNYIGAPAALDTVVAVGGTQITKNGSSYSESLWESAGGGCGNPYNLGKPGVPKPPWQTDNRWCHYRDVADTSAQAGCAPGVAEYASKYGGWFSVCGTSVAAPLMAGMIALAGNAAAQDGGKTFWEKTHHTDLYDVCGRFCLFSTYAFGGGWGSPKGLNAL